MAMSGGRMCFEGVARGSAISRGRRILGGRDTRSLKQGRGQVNV
jgi:hypothetical protein